MATPIGDLSPKGTFDEVKMPVVIGRFLIVGAPFLFGLAVRSAALRQSGLWIERTLPGRLPLYNTVKNLTRGLVGAQGDTAFRSAGRHSPDGEREIVYVTEDHGNGQMTVPVPWAPASFAGSVKIVGSDRIEMLDASVGDASRVPGHWGVRARELSGEKVSAQKLHP